MSTSIYRTITSRSFDLKKLTKAEQRCLAAVVGKYQTKPEWSQFASWWLAHLSESGIEPGSPVYRICDDLEARLGIAQEKVAPPDYRDFLADLIEAQYGTRYKFCKETGIDQGQLSRVFAGRADLSLELLQKVLQLLRAALVVQPEETLRANASLDVASRALAPLRGWRGLRRHRQAAH